jgi:hypothetical protein
VLKPKNQDGTFEAQMNSVQEEDRAMSHRDLYSSWFLVVAMLAAIAL